MGLHQTSLWKSITSRVKTEVTYRLRVMLKIHAPSDVRFINEVAEDYEVQRGHTFPIKNY
jgi:hypothetical protein